MGDGFRRPRMMGLEFDGMQCFLCKGHMLLVEKSV